MAAALWIHGDDPSPQLEAAFLRIARDRMAGLPLLNPALRVQAIGFERWQRQWLGALVTPWFLNLVLVPGSADGWRAAMAGQRVFHRFGAGDFAFLGCNEPELGEFQSCSLISTMADFADQDSACATARAALRMLQVQAPVATLMGASSIGPNPAVAPGASSPVSPAAGAATAIPSRRAMLFGRRLRSPDPA